MNRKLIALAAAGLFGPALALADGSSVVLTGVIHGDIGFGREKCQNSCDGEGGSNEAYKRQANIGTFASRWEIDGTEDLGWSKAIFGLAFDHQFAGPPRAGGGTSTNNNQINNGAEAINNRNSFLGLTGGWGTLKIGQNEHQYEIQQILQDPDPASESTYGTLTLMTGYGLGGISGFTRRDPQSIWYTSPTFGGVTIDAAYITPRGGKTENRSPQGFQLAAQWKAAFGLALYGAYAQYNDESTSVGSISSSDNKNQALRVGAGFGTDLFQVDVAGEQLKFKANDVSGDNEVKRNNFMVSGAVNFGQHHIRLAGSFARKAKVGGDTLDNSGARLFYLGYGFTVSKRTEFQVIYGKVDNKDNASFGVSAPGNDADRFGIGVRHSF